MPRGRATTACPSAPRSAQGRHKGHVTKSPITINITIAAEVTLAIAIAIATWKGSGPKAQGSGSKVEDASSSTQVGYTHCHGPHDGKLVSRSSTAQVACTQLAS